MARAKAGDKEAFEVLVRHNADRLYAVVLRFSATEADAEEATQEAFLRAWRNLQHRLVGGLAGPAEHRLRPSSNAR